MTARLDAGEKLIAALVAILLLTPLVSLSQDLATVNHDVSWILYAGERLLDGGRYGVDVIELNPPLILWIGAAVSGLGRLSSLPSPLLFNLLVLAGILVSSASVYRILVPRFEHSALPFAMALLLPPAQILICDYEYGQRDHLIFLLMTPQILIAALSPGGEESTRLGRLSAAAATALAVSVKPHFALVWAATELLSAWRSGRFRVLWREDNCLIVGLGAIYILSVIIFVPQYFAMARQAMAVYSAYDAPVPLVSADAAPMLVAAVIILILRPRGVLGRCATSALVASLMSFACLYIQHKNYPYHYIPPHLFALLAVLLAVCARLDSLPALATRKRAIQWTGALAAVALSGLFLVRGFDRVEADRRVLSALIHERGRGLPVLFLSSSVSAAFPVVPMSGVRSASPYPCIWQVAGHYSVEELARDQFPYRARDAMPPLEREVLTTVVDWMEREKPGLLLFDLKRYQQGFLWASFAWEQYLKADPRFIGLMSRYQSIGPVGDYYVLVRLPEPPSR